MRLRDLVLLVQRLGATQKAGLHFGAPYCTGGVSGANLLTPLEGGLRTGGGNAASAEKAVSVFNQVFGFRFARNNTNEGTDAFTAALLLALRSVC